MDSTMAKLHDIRWTWATQDSASQSQIERRIVAKARKQGLITYSDAVEGIDFNIPTVNNGQPFRIDVHHFTPLDRAILGDFLGYTSSRSYERAGFMISALVVNKDEYAPSWHFFEWMKQLDILPDTKEQTVLAFWADQVHKAHQWFGGHRSLDA